MKNIIEFDHPTAKDYSELIARYEKYSLYENSSPSTIKTYSQEVKQFLSFLKDDLKSLDIVHIYYYRSELQDKQKLKSVTINKKLQALKSFFTYLYKADYIEEDFSNKMPLLKIQKTRVAPKALEEHEINLLLQFAGSNSKKILKLRNYTMIQLLLGTGIRLDELVNLDYGDITINDRSGHLTIRKGKGLKERVVFLNSKVRNALSLYFDYRVEKYSLERLEIDDPAISNQSNKRMSSRSVQKVIQTLAQKARIDRIQVTPHTFRHTFANKYYSATKDILSLQALLGHESLDTTGDYALPTQADILESLDKL